jgi:hypothetical protein
VILFDQRRNASRPQADQVLPALHSAEKRSLR